jgi:Carboxypeptidase regulatory-like domain
MRRFIMSILYVLLICLLSSSMAFAQENPTGTLVGVVTDSQGGAVVGAKITVTDMAAGTVVSTKSGEGGQFTVNNLAPSVYKVTIEVKNFKTSIFTNVTITVGKTFSLPAKLEVGEETITVQVEGGGEQLMETQSATITNTVTGKAITQLPFNSRSAVLLGVLDPGAETSGGTRNSAFEGLPKGAINITFDGINVQDNLLKSSDGFFAINDPRIDDVEEFAITTGVNSPDKSGEGAVQMNYVSKRGGNSFHGGAWEYNRNTAFNSNTYFNNLNGTPRQNLQLNDYGAKVGGPILKDKLFFFVDIDNFIEPASITRSRSILTPLAASGSYTYIPVGPDGSTPMLPSVVGGLAPGNTTLPWVSCSASTGTPLCTVNLLQMAAAGGFTGTINPTISGRLTAAESSATASGVTISPSQPSLYQETINFNNSGTQSRRYPDARLDFQINKKNSLELDYHYAHYTSSPDILNGMDAAFPGSTFAPNQGSQISNRNLFVAAWRWTIGANTNNELRFGAQVAPVNFGVGITSGQFPTINSNLGSQPYTYSIFGVSPLFNGFGDNQGRNSALGQISDNFGWTKGRHAMTFGVSATSIWYNDFFESSGTLNFGVDNNNDPIVTDSATGPNSAPFLGNAVFSGGPGSCSPIPPSMVPISPGQCQGGGALPGIGNNDFLNAESLYSSLTGRVQSFTASVFYSPQTGAFKTGAPAVDKWRQNEVGFYFADSWRVKSNLTFSYGLRWELPGAPSDSLNEYSTIAGGADGLFGVSGAGNLFKPGVLAGDPNTTYVNDKGYSWYHMYKGAFAPTVGIAWQPHSDMRGLHQVLGSAGKTVFRAGYNIAYSREGLAGFSSLAGANPGYFGSQLTQSDVVNDPSQGLFVAGSVILNSTTNLANVVQTPSQFSQSFPLGISDGTSINEFDPNIRPPMIQSWSAGVQRELSANNVIEVRYVANHGSGLWDQFNINEVNIFENGFLTEFNHAASNLTICSNNAAACVAAQKDLGVLTQTSTATTPTLDFADLFAGATAACAAPVHPPSCATSIAALSGQVAVPVFTAAYTGSTTGSQADSHFTSSTYVPLIQQGLAGSVANIFSGTLTRYENIVNAGFPANYFIANPTATLGGAFVMANGAQSTYNSLQVDFRRRPSHGLQFDVSYVFAKALTNYNANSSVNFAQFTTLRNLNYDKGPAPFDIRNAIKGQMVWSLPFGSGRRWLNSSTGVMNRLVGGWEIDSIVRWQTGTPINITSGLGGTTNGSDPGVILHGITPNQLQSMLTVNKTEQTGAVFYVPSSLLTPNLQKVNTAVISPCNTPGALCQKLFVNGPQFFVANISVVKTTKITERVNVEIRMEALNAFNNANFYYACGVSTTPCSISLQSSSFGKIAGNYSDFNTNQDPGGRIIQLVGRINF